MDINDFLEWQEMSKQLKILKEREAKKRIELCNKVFEGAYKTRTINIAGFKITATAKFNTKIDEAIFNSIYDNLSTEELSVVKLTPTLDKRKYNKLPVGKIELLNSAITVKPGRPTLLIKEITNGNKN